MTLHLSPIAFVMAAAMAAPAAAGPETPGAWGGACAAIARSVVQLLGAGATVTSCETDGAPPAEAWLEAAPDGAARVGQWAMFTLVASRATTRVRARIDVRMPHARAARTLVRGTMIAAGDVAEDAGSLAGAAFQRVLRPASLVTARTKRPLEAGSVIQAGDVLLAPVIASGQAVVAVVRIGAVEVSAAMTAVDAGAIGDEIRVANREQKRVLRARVVGPGRVEVVNAENEA